MNGTPPRIEKAEIVRALRLYNDGPTEIRALNAKFAGRTGTVSGYFDSPETAADEIAKVQSWSGIYFVANAINPALMARRANRLAVADKGDATTDTDIIRRHWLLIDADAIRPAKISSSDAENEAAIEVARQVADFLAQNGWPEPIAADSGNGAHLTYRIDLPADDGGLVERVLAALAERFNDDKVKIDTVNGNAARIWKLPGTLSCKGDSTVDRPHRMARILSAPEAPVVVLADQLEHIAAQVQPKLSKPQTPSRANGTPFDADAWIVKFEPDGDGPHPYNGGRKWILKQCAFDPSHDGSSAVIIQHASGAMDYRCLHNSCSGNRWAEYREMRAPGYRDRQLQPKPEAPAVMAILRRGCDIERRPIEWLWQGRLAIGKINLLFGQPGLGKSLIVTDLAARVTRGKDWPDGRSNAPMGSVIIASAEDDFSDTLMPRFDAAGGDDKRLVALEGIKFPGEGGRNRERAFTLRDLPQLADAIERTENVKLVILDPISAFLGDTDSHKNADVRGLLSPLKTLAETRRICFLLVTHLPKGTSTNAINGAIGSIAFVAAARSAWLIAKDRDDSRRRIMAAAKSNLGPDAGALAYRVALDSSDTPIIAWEADPVDVTADELIVCDARPGPAPEARERAEGWLRERLAGGAVSAGELAAQAEAAGIKSGTLNNAGKAVGVKKEKNGFDGGWTWRLPKAAAEDSK